MNDHIDPGDLNPEDIAQLAVTGVAHQFFQAAAGGGDLLAVWPLADPLLRLCWAQHWIHANERAIASTGRDRDELARELAEDAPDHPLWEHFERVSKRNLALRTHQGIGADPANWGIGATPRVLGVDTELLYVHDVTTLPGGVFQPGTYSVAVPIVMRFADQQWRVLNVGAEIVPEPGWPPRLW